MEPEMSSNDKKMFYNYLNKANVYFEFGSGGSTYQANVRKNIKKIYSVESDIEWHIKLKNKLKNDKIKYIFNEMNTKPNTWGNPGEHATDIQKINYSDQIKKLKKEDIQNIDLILIDGRFRVACCLKCYDLINDECLIAFDDFLNRTYYHVVLDYFDIVDKTIDNRMVILKKKNIINNLIKKYELIRY